MTDVKLTSDKGSMEKRIADRLKPSGAPGAAHSVTHGTGPTRTVTQIHHSANHTRPGKSEDGR
jgi:hypothetical protein